MRVAVGVGLAMTLGPVGAAVGTRARRLRRLRGLRRRRTGLAVRPRRSTRRARLVTAGALAVGAGVRRLAVMQTTDLLVANRVLGADDAAAFGVLSTLGGAAFFATATIPLVLMPAAVRGRATRPRSPWR